MFSVGDKIVYPMHGAGIVQAIEQHELAGEAVDYLGNASYRYACYGAA